MNNDAKATVPESGCMAGYAIKHPHVNGTDGCEARQQTSTTCTEQTASSSTSLHVISGTTMGPAYGKTQCLHTSTWQHVVTYVNA